MTMQQDLSAALLSLIDEVCGLRKEWDDFLFFYILEAVAATPVTMTRALADML